MKKFRFFAAIGLILLMAFPVYATVSSETTRVKYTCNGTTTVYAYPFTIYEDDDLLAVKALTSTGAETTLVLNTDYTVSGAGVAGGGNLTLTAGSVCPSGYTLTILRNIELTQETDYVDGQAFSAESLESAIDKVALIQQQQAEQIGRAPKLPKSSSITDIALPNPVASNLIGWNAAGTALINRTDGITLTTATGYEVDALVTYGGGVNYTQATIESALAAIGTVNKVTLLIRPGTWPIISNVDWSAYTNVTFKVVPGAVISHSTYTLNIPNPDAGLYQWLSGTGIVTVSGNVKEVYPQWWGAMGDNSTNDTAAIQAALNCVYTSGGGVLFFGKGTYLITQISKVWTAEIGITFRGIGRKETLISKYGVGTDTLFVFSSAIIRVVNLVMEDMAIQGGSTANGISIDNLAYFTFKRLYLIGSNIGIDFRGAITGIVEDSIFYANIKGIKLDQTVGQGGSNNIKIKDCIFTGNSTLAIDYVADSGLHIEGCDFENNGTSLSSPLNLLTASWVNDAISPYDTLTSSGGNITSAIEVTSFGKGSNDMTNLTAGVSYTISYNLTLNSGEAPTLYIMSLAASGFICTFGQLKTGANVITFTGVANSNFLVVYNGSPANFSLTISLYVSNVTGAIRTRPNVGVQSWVGLISIDKCWFESNKGFDLYIEPTGYAVYISLSNSKGLGSEFGIFVGKVHKFTGINLLWPNNNLQFDPSGTNTVAFIINSLFARIFGTSGHYIHILGTNFDAAFLPVWSSDIATGGAIITDAGITIGSEQARITKHLSAAVMYDPPSVAAGAQISTTVTVTGAALGNTVVVGFGVDLQGMQLTGYVNVANTVAVILRNGTAGAIDLVSGALRADVWQH